MSISYIIIAGIVILAILLICILSTLKSIFAILFRIERSVNFFLPKFWMNHRNFKKFAWDYAHKHKEYDEDGDFDWINTSWAYELATEIVEKRYKSEGKEVGFDKKALEEIDQLTKILSKHEKGIIGTFTDPHPYH